MEMFTFPPSEFCKLQLWAAAESLTGEAEQSLPLLFCAVCLPPAGREGDWGSCWDCCSDSWESRRSTLWIRTESRTFFSSEENRLRTWRSTDVFPVGRPIPTRSLCITCGRDERLWDTAAVYQHIKQITCTPDVTVSINSIQMSPFKSKWTPQMMKSNKIKIKLK